MTTSVFPLRYFLPITRFAITLTERLDGDSVITISSALAADRGARCRTEVKESLLETVSLTVTLDDNGVISSIGTESGRDVAALVKFAAKVIPLATFRAADRPKSLADQWIDQHERSADLLGALSARLDALLTSLAAAAEPAEIVSIGNALQVVERELAALDRVRREWIARQGTSVLTADVSANQVVNLDRSALPGTLPREQSANPALRGLIAKNLLPVLASDRASLPESNYPSDLEHEDALVFRRARPATLGIYRRGSAAEAWTLDEALVLPVDVIDQFSEQEKVSFDGEVWRKRKIDLAFHPDGSIKTYGVTSTSAVSGVADAAGGLIDSLVAARKERAAAPSEAEQALDEAKTRLDLLQTSTELAQLAATHDRAGELAELDQLVKLAELRAKVR
ncbi:hypothetical protein [Lentzea sp. CA-135723]|uniref:hypothetical protein n=1 Tax=Lentzea sp. CA-135723 TaxID=3239950 RepID=UPI003D9242C8